MTIPALEIPAVPQFSFALDWAEQLACKTGQPTIVSAVWTFTPKSPTDAPNITILQTTTTANQATIAVDTNSLTKGNLYTASCQVELSDGSYDEWEGDIIIKSLSAKRKAC